MNTSKPFSFEYNFKHSSNMLSKRANMSSTNPNISPKNSIFQNSTNSLKSKNIWNKSEATQLPDSREPMVFFQSQFVPIYVNLGNDHGFYRSRYKSMTLLTQKNFKKYSLIQLRAHAYITYSKIDPIENKTIPQPIQKIDNSGQTQSNYKCPYPNSPFFNFIQTIYPILSETIPEEQPEDIEAFAAEIYLNFLEKSMEQSQLTLEQGNSSNKESK